MFIAFLTLENFYLSSVRRVKNAFYNHYQTDSKSFKAIWIIHAIFNTKNLIW